MDSHGKTTSVVSKINSTKLAPKEGTTILRRFHVTGQKPPFICRFYPKTQKVATRNWLEISVAGVLVNCVYTANTAASHRLRVHTCVWPRAMRGGCIDRLNYELIVWKLQTAFQLRKGQVITDSTTSDVTCGHLHTNLVTKNHFYSKNDSDWNLWWNEHPDL